MVLNLFSFIMGEVFIILVFLSILGTKNETFIWYFKELIKAMKMKYSDKELVFVLDNLWAHKCSLIIDHAIKEKVNILLTPSNTPEFSPIENLFGHVKRELKDYENKRGVKGE